MTTGPHPDHGLALGAARDEGEIAERDDAKSSKKMLRKMNSVKLVCRLVSFYFAYVGSYPSRSQSAEDHLAAAA